MVFFFFSPSMFLFYYHYLQKVCPVKGCSLHQLDPSSPWR